MPPRVYQLRPATEVVELKPCLFVRKWRPKKVTLYVFLLDTGKIWGVGNAGDQVCDTFEFPTNATVASVMDEILPESAGSKHPWMLTEVWRGDGGAWTKAFTIKYASEKAAGTLKSFGWTSKRGKEESRVYLVLHKK